MVNASPLISDQKGSLTDLMHYNIGLHLSDGENALQS